MERGENSEREVVYFVGSKGDEADRYDVYGSCEMQGAFASKFSADWMERGRFGHVTVDLGPSLKT